MAVVDRFGFAGSSLITHIGACSEGSGGRVGTPRGNVWKRVCLSVMLCAVSLFCACGYQSAAACSTACTAALGHRQPDRAIAIHPDVESLVAHEAGRISARFGARSIAARRACEQLPAPAVSNAAWDRVARREIGRSSLERRDSV